MLKKIVLWFSVILVFLLAVAVIIAAFFEDALGKRLITELNKTLKSEITYKSFDLSLIKGFPNASASLKGVVIPDSQKGTLLEAESISFRFAMMSLFSEAYDIKSVVIENGALRISYDKAGQSNLDIFKPTPKATTSSEMSIALQEAIFKNIELIYEDVLKKQEVLANIHSGKLVGQFSSKEFSLGINGDFTTDFVEISGERFFPGKKMECDALLDVNMEEGIYEFRDVKWDIEGNVFDIDGKMIAKEKYADYDLTFGGKDCKFQSLVKILPPKYLEPLGGLSSTGKLVFSTAVKGRSSAKETPGVQLQLGIDRGTISHPDLGVPLRNVSFNARMSNGKERSSKKSTLQVSNFKASMAGKPLSFNLKIADFDNPKMDGTFNGTLPLKAIYKLLGSELITSGDGLVEVKDFKLKGNYSDMINPNRIGAVETFGDFIFKDALLKMNGQNITATSGKLNLKGNKLKVTDLRMEGAGSKFSLNGNFENLFPVMLADSLNSKDAELKFIAKINSKRMNLDKLFALTDIPVEEGDVSKEKFDSLEVEQTRQREHITKFLDGRFDVLVEKITYRKFEGENLKGELRFKNNLLEINDAAMASMEGNYKLDGEVYFTEKPKLEARMVCNRIDSKEFFRQWENFGQEELTHKNIKGRLNGKILIRAYWDEQGNYLDDKLYALADLNFKSGEIYNLKMLEGFSSYVKKNDLKRIKFENLRNYVEIDKGKIRIPIMFIQNNAMNMTVAGFMSFSGKLEYFVKINAAQVFWNKINIFKKGNKPIKAKNGMTNTYFRIYGSLDNYQYSMDRKRATRKFESSERYKKKLHKKLTEAFNAVDLITEDPDLEDKNSSKRKAEKEEPSEPEEKETKEEKEAAETVNVEELDLNFEDENEDDLEYIEDF